MIEFLKRRHSVWYGPQRDSAIPINPTSDRNSNKKQVNKCGFASSLADETLGDRRCQIGAALFYVGGRLDEGCRTK